MGRYRKKPIVIEAVQWQPGQQVEGVRYDKAGDLHYVATLEGPLRVSPGDWIITGTQAEKYPCKDSIFRKIYEPVEEGSP